MSVEQKQPIKRGPKAAHVHECLSDVPHSGRCECECGAVLYAGFDWTEPPIITITTSAGRASADGATNAE